jgi:hypothetical protein
MLRAMLLVAVSEPSEHDWKDILANMAIGVFPMIDQ